jgi:hypothetical protein
MVYARIRSSALILEPTTEGDVPPGAVFIDSANSYALSTKTIGGTKVQISAATSADILVKMKYNSTGAAIAAYQQIALKEDGSICLSDSDNPEALIDIGITLDLIDNGSFGRVLLNGPNVMNALTGLGFLTGDTVYLSKTPGALTNDSLGFDPETDMIMKVGIADCPSNEIGTAATDLIMVTEVISTP